MAEKEERRLGWVSARAKELAKARADALKNPMDRAEACAVLTAIARTSGDEGRVVDAVRGVDSIMGWSAQAREDAEVESAARRGTRATPAEVLSALADFLGAAGATRTDDALAALEASKARKGPPG